MAIETTESGTMITGDEINVFQVLRVASALGLEVTTKLTHSRGSVMQLAAGYCGSGKRTKAGVWVDYVVWLAGYGLQAPGRARVAGHLNQANKEALERGLRKADTLARRRQTAAK